ncbi:type II 3-dehydroquinate dehydratase [Wenzhouxiangella sp. XN79A]|uniref:type II 3-dehydroquinate dehydratase n=1 Tax=Wenzhouxiangella sp. XN79A TaxID=2724193 RepID=UPI00144A813D|nr:type II 3-dehydroquinate dehydratase [Wenzhouxiangella sp. XN79A]NKI33578.1 type II 3-dehydroquinate dehydratase [Wenzhouxiangella sp. XN79A]
MRILILHGPNLNLLGRREPAIYGRTTLAEIDDALGRIAREAGCTIECLQSNAEHELIDRIQQTLDADGRVDGIVINPAAFTHTSVALRDALAASGVPFVEVHLSMPEAREPFRHRSLLADLAVGRVSGFGARSYNYALQGLIGHLNSAASE